MQRLPRSIVLTAALAACSGDAPEPEIPTAELGIQVFGVVADGEVSVSATLTTRTPDGTRLVQIPIPDGDRLVARIGDAATELTLEVTDQGTPIHRGVVAGDAGDLVVGLERAAGEDAPRSVVTLPAPFELTSPPTRHARGSELTIAWDAGVADTVRVLLDGPDCVAGSEVRFDEDLGSATVPAAGFEATATAADPCTAILQVDRLRDGAADSALGRGGRVEAVITRAIALTITD